MSRVDVMTELGLRWRDGLPSVLRDSPEHLSVLHVIAKEAERAEEKGEQVRAQFFIGRADLLLGLWEAQFRTTVAPVGESLATRRTTVKALMKHLAGTPEGREWVATVTALIGPSWSYEEYDPSIPWPAGPPAGTLRVTLPFPPASDRYRQIERLLRTITPAHIDIIVQYEAGFVLDESRLDEEGLG